MNEGSLHLYRGNNYPHKCELASQDQLIDLYDDEQYLEKAVHSESINSRKVETVETGWHGRFPFYPEYWEGSDQGCFNLASLGECSNAKVLEKCKKTCAHLQYHNCLIYLCAAINLKRGPISTEFNPICKKYCENYYNHENIYKLGWEISKKFDEIGRDFWSFFADEKLDEFIESN